MKRASGGLNGRVDDTAGGGVEVEWSLDGSVQNVQQGHLPVCLVLRKVTFPKLLMTLPLVLTKQITSDILRRHHNTMIITSQYYDNYKAPRPQVPYNYHIIRFMRSVKKQARVLNPKSRAGSVPEVADVSSESLLFFSFRCLFQ